MFSRGGCFLPYKRKMRCRCYGEKWSNIFPTLIFHRFSSNKGKSGTFFVVCVFSARTAYGMKKILFSFSFFSFFSFRFNEFLCEFFIILTFFVRRWDVFSLLFFSRCFLLLQMWLDVCRVRVSERICVFGTSGNLFHGVYVLECP